jgi:hypothetical protein
VADDKPGLNWCTGSAILRSDIENIIDPNSFGWAGVNEYCNKNSLECTLFVLSQTCDLLHIDPAVEPHAELIAGFQTDRDANSPTNLRLKSLRTLDIEIDSKKVWRLENRHRIFVNRQKLLAKVPDITVSLSLEKSRNLSDWISLRYGRRAFPNSLVSAFSGKPKVEDKIRKAQADIEDIYLGLSTFDELEDPKQYLAKILLVQKTVPSNAEKLNQAIDELKDFAEQTLGVVVVSTDFSVKPVSDVRLSDLQNMHKWNFEYMSHDSKTGRRT